MTNDVGLSTFPRGGIIVSVGSSAGLGFQPLVAAGGTAVVSSAGTITSVAIGNSGSGYRSGVQTTVNVSVGTSSLAGSNLVRVGVASISNGNIVSVAITNPGARYTTTNPPFVVFDNPLSYNLALEYVSGTTDLEQQVELILLLVKDLVSLILRLTILDMVMAITKDDSFCRRNTGIPTTSSFSPSEQLKSNRKSHQ